MRYILLAYLLLTGCSSANQDWIDERADEVWLANGFTVVTREGFKWGVHVGPTFGGANVWYRLRKIPDNGITYSGYIQRWGDEPQVYGPLALDAIRP